MPPHTATDLINESLAGAAMLQRAHYRAAASYQTAAKYLGLPSALCGSITTTTMAGLLGDIEMPQWVKITATACGAVSLLGSAMMSTLNYAASAQQHQSAAIAWGSLRGKFARMSAQDVTTITDINGQLRQLGEEWDAINRSSPVLHQKFFKHSQHAAEPPKK
jgi:hypothetical protein